MYVDAIEIALTTDKGSDNKLPGYHRHGAETAPRRRGSSSRLELQPRRDFSSVGRTVTEMRSRLSADKVEALELVRSGMRLGVL